MRRTPRSRGVLVDAAHGLELWRPDSSGEPIQFHPVAHTLERVNGAWSALRTVWNCGGWNRVENRFNSIPWRTRSGARRGRRPSCAWCEILVGVLGGCAPLELSRTDADGAGSGIRVPGLVVERTDRGRRASTTTGRVKRPETMQRARGCVEEHGVDVCSSTLRTVWNCG